MWAAGPGRARDDRTGGLVRGPQTSSREKRMGEQRRGGTMSGGERSRREVRSETEKKREEERSLGDNWRYGDDRGENQHGRYREEEESGRGEEGGCEGQVRGKQRREEKERIGGQKC